MNPIQVRESIINVLLQQSDAQHRTIEGLQKQVADLTKELATFKPPSEEPKAEPPKPQ